jgi:hypothetical protein
VTSTDARCLTSLTSLAYGTDVHGLALPLHWWPCCLATLLYNVEGTDVAILVWLHFRAVSPQIPALCGGA